MNTNTKHGFVSTQPATTWEEGLICGNGTIGANALSRPLDEIIIFSHERLFLPSGPPVLPPDMGPRLFEVRRLIDRGLYSQASQLASDISEQSGFLYPDPFVPAFELQIHTESRADAVSNYSRSVNFCTGEAVVTWSNGEGGFERRLFVSRSHGLGVMQLTGPGPGGLSCQLSVGSRQPEKEIDAQKAEESTEQFETHIGNVRTSVTNDTLIYGCQFSQAYPGSIQSLQGQVRVIASGVETNVDDDTLTLINADSVLLLIGIELLYDPNHDGTDELTARFDAATGNYDVLLRSHARLHGKLFNRVSLSLGGDKDHDRSSEELLSEATDETLNVALVEKLFDAGRHNIISSTGELPPALQGIWGGTYAPDWAGDFTHNGNVPSAIAGLLMGNTPELMLSYTSYLESLVPYMELNARRIFSARGIVLPSRTSTHGFNNALDPHFAGGFWVAGAAWAAHHFYDYWLYTGDSKFLAEHALPFMHKAAIFFEDFLYEGADGKFIFSPTQSPENIPGNSDSQASFNATMDVAAAKELLKNLIVASQKLGVNAKRISRWQEMLTKMPDYLIDDEGIIKEWSTPYLTNCDSHRHSSHLYALYDGISEEIAGDQRLRRAFKKAIRNKLDRHWSNDALGFMSFGVAQLGQAAASLGDGELAYECLIHLVNRYWLSNLASMHNHKSLFNMDVSGSLPAVVMKMLVTSEPGSVTLLPALPKAWPTGMIEGVLCRGQIEVKRLRWNPQQIDVALVSAINQTIVMKAPFRLQCSSSESADLAPVDGNQQTIALFGGHEIELKWKISHLA